MPTCKKSTKQPHLRRRWSAGRQKLQFCILRKRHECMEFRIRVKDVMHCVTRALRKKSHAKNKRREEQLHLSSSTEGATRGRGAGTLAQISIRGRVCRSSWCCNHCSGLEVRFCWEARAFRLKRKGRPVCETKPHAVNYDRLPGASWTKVCCPSADEPVIETREWKEYR
jgi:hypothetical protein